jgi:hypothetical protein
LLTTLSLQVVAEEVAVARRLGLTVAVAVVLVDTELAQELQALIPALNHLLVLS